MTTDITELALIKGQRVEAPYYLAECTECGKMYSSSKLIVSRNYFDGDADCYCPHCNADDADIADLGSGEQPAVMAWNYQQARIDTLVEALEKAQRYIEELREWNAGLAQESCERQQLISELEPISAAAEKLVRCKGRYHSEQNYRALAALFGVTTPDLPPLEHENVHYADAAEMEIAALRQRIAELESRTVTVKLPQRLQPGADGWDDWYVHSDDEGEYLKFDDVLAMLTAAGIKVEAE
ncbi:ead/Ea22-like family protein [Klebsiella pneumoniae]|uniref:ead/Ea22-like family protein n=1 Tax=Klebsiella pneumoniae TaxID=573 RepID=UPI000AEA7217|nr:ead/Ea22-like family protein [Klebsiella pneumoniae]MDP1489222.1 ead/Ea22-like family protein [Klebsiella pneumoniae]MDT9814498.1 ead/Ea22-like family protein [Klebsiella pneumoniae]MEC6295888.1 ead/Ea22-like family protein [Klebsiella pneumoniae]